MRFAHFNALLVASLALASASPQAAPPKVREGTLGGGKTSGPIMSVAQLRACVVQQTRIQGLNTDTTKTQQQMTTDRAAIETEGQAIKDAMPALDRTNKEAVEAYVARAQAHDTSIDTYQARVSPFNAQVEALQAERASYAKACEGRRYLEDDYADIKAGK